MSGESILRVVAKILIPLILLFAFYVQFHGDFGPGGGFQAGVIFAAAIVLYSLVFGRSQGLRVFRPEWAERLAAAGVLIYGGTGVVALLRGGNFLDYNALNPHHPSHGQELGIFCIELGVGLAVASVMTTIFFTFSGRRRSR
jgi:multicomponent Na+:H+ antiporter subunit B